MTVFTLFFQWLWETGALLMDRCAAASSAAGNVGSGGGFFDGFTWAQGATLLTAIIGITGVAFTLLTAAARARRDRLATLYADAIFGVSEYLEGPYRVRCKDGTAPTRYTITSKLSDVKTAIDHSQALLRLHARGGVADAYDAYVNAAKREAGQQMHDAWELPSTLTDADVNLHQPYPRALSDVARALLLEVMQADLARRWWRPVANKRHARAGEAARATA